jgi:type I site-specific restriction-modification system R (restriction) subunit
LLEQEKDRVPFSIEEVKDENLEVSDIPPQEKIIIDESETEFQEAMRQSLLEEERKKKEMEELVKEEERLIKEQQMKDQEQSLLNRRIRKEQDEAYHKSLKEDQEKEKKKQEYYNKMMMEEEKIEEEKAIKMSLQLDKSSRCSEAFRNLPPEPSINDANTTHVVVRMPNGDRIERRFLSTDKIQLLKDFIDSKSIDFDLPDQYQIVSTYPKKTFNELGKTFSDYNLTGRILVAVEIL